MPLHMRRMNLHPKNARYPDDHYAVFNDDGCMIGVVLFRIDVQKNSPAWGWSINGDHVVGVVNHSGKEWTRDEAKEQVARGWRTWLEHNKLPENYRPRWGGPPMTPEERAIWRLPPLAYEEQ